MNMNEAYERFILVGSAHWAQRTRVYYERNIMYFFRYLEQVKGKDWKEIDVDSMDRDILVEYVVWLRSKDRYSDHPLKDCMSVSGPLKNNTVNTYMRAIKAFFNFLFNERYTSVRYAHGLKLPRGDDDQIVPLLRGEVLAMDAVFDIKKPNDLRNLCIIHLMLDAGLRSCEVIALKPGDLVFASKTIVINRSKGEKSRVVIMSPGLSELLEHYIHVFRPSGTLFKRVLSNRPINESVMQSLFQRLRRNTGIGRLHPHLLRHTFATSYIMGGGNLETLRILLGHFDYSVTRKYLHLAAQYQIIGTDIYRLDPVFFKEGY